MGEAVIVALIGAILGGGGLLHRYLESRKPHSPIDRDTAEVALAQQSVEVATSSMALMQEQMSKLTAAQDRVNQRYSNMEQELNEVRGEVREVRAVVAIHVGPLIEWIDAGAPPPPPHIHGDLRQMVLAIANKDKEDG